LAIAGISSAVVSETLAIRRRWPAICLAVVLLGFAIDRLRGYRTTAATALPHRAAERRGPSGTSPRTTVVLASAANVPLAVALDRLGSAEGVSGFVTFYLAQALV